MYEIYWGGMKLRLCFVIGLLILGAFFVPAFAVDIDCRKSTEECPGSANPCRCDLATPVQVSGSQAASVGTDFSASDGRPPYIFKIGLGAINPETGVVTEVPQCPQSTTVTVTDACKQQAELAVELSAGAVLIIDGLDTPNVGDSYAASGGAPPYSWSFDGGSINSAGQITAISGCGGVDTPRWATVTVTDSCSQSAIIEVILPGGYWKKVQNCYNPISGGNEIQFLWTETDPIRGVMYEEEWSKTWLRDCSYVPTSMCGPGYAPPEEMTPAMVCIPRVSSTSIWDAYIYWIRDFKKYEWVCQ